MEQNENRRRRIVRTNRTQEPTYLEAVEEFLKDARRRQLSEPTIANYTITLRKFRTVLELPDDFKLKDLTKDDYRDFLDILQEGKELSTVSINHYIREMNAFFNWASDEDEGRGYLPYMKIKPLKEDDIGIKFYSEADLKKLIVQPSPDDDYKDWRTWAMIKFILGTGARIATVCSVKIGDINYKAKQIAYTHTKNKKAQTVPLSPQTEKDLKLFINMWRGIAEDDEWLFPSITDEQLTSNAAKKALVTYCAKRGVERSSWHSLRHSFARNWILDNGSLAELQVLLGHQTPTMTMHYVKLFGTDLNNSVEAHSLNDILSKPRNRTHKVHRTEEE